MSTHIAFLNMLSIWENLVAERGTSTILLDAWGNTNGAMHSEEGREGHLPEQHKTVSQCAMAAS